MHKTNATATNNNMINLKKSADISGISDQISQLRSQIRAVETHRNALAEDRVHSQCVAVDRLMPQSGYARGTLNDWIAPSGCAADFLSLSVAQAACENGGALVVIDPDRQFFPPAAAAMGINMDNVIVLRGEQTSAGHIRAIGQDLLWAIDQSLRCPAVAAVWGPLPKIDDRWQRRFQLSAESSGAMGLFVRPLSVARQPSWSEVQWLVSPGMDAKPKRRGPASPANPAHAMGSKNSPTTGQPQTTNDHAPYDFNVRLSLVRCRGTHGGKSIAISINTVTGSVRKVRSDRENRPSITKPIQPSATPPNVPAPSPPTSARSARSARSA